MRRIKLNDLAVVTDLTAAEAGQTHGGVYSMFAGALLVALMVKNRQRIVNRMRDIWHDNKSSICHWAIGIRWCPNS